jgi:hypothetical protein
MIKNIVGIIPNEEKLNELRAAVQSKAKDGFYRSGLNAFQRIDMERTAVHSYLNTLVKECVDIPKVVERNGNVYNFISISQGITYTRYKPGGCFEMHRDSPVNMYSFVTLFTLLIYLVDDSDGATALYPDAIGIEPAVKRFANDEIVKRISETECMSTVPKAGDAVLFDVRIPHKSLPCTGEKMMVSCKIMYSRKQ